ncbi:MAG: peptide chain release factor N(5)-glutamine methyltransferase [Paludibacter sp.]|nr:peptide chain release factor N(5)-glutamine methyltransferase [Paludibacter sp.]
MQNVIQHIQSELRGHYPENEIKSFCNLIIQKLTGFSRIEILVNKNTNFSVEKQQDVEKIIEKLKKQVPIQYILGETDFYGHTFNVNESVLIPRPETEELVDWIQKDNSSNQIKNILDIGTGSGCIAISLKHIFTNAVVDAFDISETALVTAKSNARRNKVNINFIKADILNAPKFNKKWDIIVSNPPYVTEFEKNEILPNVLEHEPHLALFVPDNDPLLFYRNIAKFAQEYLGQNGKLYFEINREFGMDCMNLLTNMGFSDVELRKDISGNDRMIRAILDSEL